MIITRKIKIFICEPEKKLRNTYLQKLYDNRTVAVKTANMCASHLFVLDNTIPYLSPQDRDTITFLGAKGTPATRNNAPYVAASREFKGKADMSMVSSVIQNVRKMYQEDRKNGGEWTRSLRSYKADMPMPFKSSQFINMRFDNYTCSNGKMHEGCFFTLIGIPFQMSFGRDRSGNRSIMRRIIDGQCKMATSHVQIKDGNIYLIVSVDMPVKDNNPVPGRKLFAFLGVLNPICCFVSTDAENDKQPRIYEIGTREEFNYRRRQIQEKLRRLQAECKYTAGGRGRKRKTQAIERFHKKEMNYVDTRLHTYSKMLVDYAVSSRCEEIVLLNQTHREEEAKQGDREGEPFVLRNWSYYQLKQKIEYKAKLNNIKLTVRQ